MLLSGVQGITDLITTPGLINLDFADVKSVMSGAGSALMGIGSARGDDRSVAAAEMAISSPLLEASIDGAHGVLLSIQGGSDLGLFEINEAAQLVANSAAPDANIIFGAVIDDALGDEVRVTVIAAGFDEGRIARTRPGRAMAAQSAAPAAPAAADGYGAGGGWRAADFPDRPDAAVAAGTPAAGSEAAGLVVGGAARPRCGRRTACLRTARPGTAWLRPACPPAGLPADSGQAPRRRPGAGRRPRQWTSSRSVRHRPGHRPASYGGDGVPSPRPGDLPAAAPSAGSDGPGAASRPEPAAARANLRSGQHPSAVRGLRGGRRS